MLRDRAEQMCDLPGYLYQSRPSGDDQRHEMHGSSIIALQFNYLNRSMGARIQKIGHVEIIL
jgi:hypothetical protein